MSPRLVNGIAAALFDSDLVATRLTLAVAEAFWALMLWWPGDSFTRPTYAGMAAIAPELCWAALFTVSALVQASIVVERSFDSKHARWFAWFNAALWVYVMGAALLSVYPPPAAMGGEMALVCAAVWIAVRPSMLDKIERKARGHHAPV